jgi:CTP:molybdopterin cytidylyltransferase MocA
MARPAIVLLAAGTSSRYGTSPKQLAVLEDGRSLVRRAAETALSTALPVWVVTGAGAERVQDVLAGLPLSVVHNAEWTRGMGSSLSVGVRQAMEAGASAVIVMLADQPLVDAGDLRALLQEHAAHANSIIAAEYGAGVSGPPCLFPAADFPALVALDGDRGARQVIKQNADRVRRVAMPHAALDVDTPQDLARASDLLRK